MNQQQRERMAQNKKLKIIIIGGGGRGTIYARHLLRLADRAEVVAIAEPRDFFRNRIGDLHHIPEERRFRDWRDILKQPKFADAAVIATQDKQHLEPALAFAALKYHILIEKPLAPTLEECRDLIAAAEANDIILSVCHVLRYTNYTRKLKELLDNGAIGKVMTVQHLEPVGHWRFAHSYVRGNWRKEAESSSVLLAKSIHDLDWICYIVNSEAKAVSSFGSLMYFKKENQPQGAADRCLDCKLQDSCPYAAPRFYLERVRSGNIGAYVESVSGEATEENILNELRTGLYGRCVFACDNDVADHQVVNMEFKNGATAVFTLAGCSKFGNRRTTVFGSHGELFGDGERLTLHSYLTGKTEEIEVPSPSVPDHHWGGDYNMVQAFVDAAISGDKSGIVTGPEISLATHYLVFAAEIARNNGAVLKMKDFFAQTGVEKLIYH